MAYALLAWRREDPTRFQDRAGMFQEPDKKHFKEKIAGADGLVIVNFWASWSRQGGYVSYLLRELADVLDDRDTYMNLDWDVEKRLAKKLNVFGVPTLLIFFRGKEVIRHSGEIERDNLAKLFEEARKYQYSFPKNPP